MKTIENLSGASGPASLANTWKGSLFHHPLTWILLIYTALGLGLLTVYQFQINPDGIAYLDLAEKYVRGDLWGAVNAYWSPLISWLTALLRLLGLPPQLAVKLVLLMGGGVALGGVWRLVESCPLWKRAIATGGAVPLTLYYALHVITPDLLVAAGLVWYAVWLVEGRLDVRASVWGGLVMALGYFAKAFALPFCVVHLCGWRLLAERQVAWRQRLWSLAVSLSVLACVSGVWIIALREKYGMWMFSSVGRYNYALAGPRMGFVLPTETAFFAPAEAGDTSAWTDPTRLPIQPWSPFESATYTQYQVLMTLDRLRVMAFEHSFSYSVLALPIILGLVAGVWFLPRQRRRFSVLLSGSMLYVAGYALVYVEPRHLLPLAYWVLVSGVWLVLSVTARQHFFGRLQVALLSVVVGTMAWSPAYALVQGMLGNDADLEVCRGLYRAAQAMRVQLGVQGRIASNREWHRSLYLTWFLGGRYYGVAPPYADPEEVARLLKDHQVNYYFVWSDENGTFPDVRWGEEITGGQDVLLRIYCSQPDQVKATGGLVN
ncbi:MAG: hypothetical protein ACUVR8_04615 [Acidobacteriota bacterium]